MSLRQDTYPAILESLLTACVLTLQGHIDSQLDQALNRLGTLCGATLLIATVRVPAHLCASIPVCVLELVDALLLIAKAGSSEGRGGEETKGGEVDELHGGRIGR